MLIACLIGMLSCHIENTFLKILRKSNFFMQEINNDLKYLIQFLDARYNE